MVNLYFKNKLYVLLLFTLLLNCKVNAQIFRLDSVIVSKLQKDSIATFLQRNSNGINLPIFVEDKSFMDLFNLTDTLINGVHLNFVNSKKDIIDRYFLKKDNREFLYANISLHLVTKTNIIVRFNYITFKCDKWFFKNLPLILKSNGFTQIEYNILTKEIIVKEVSW